jgi:hypothetical protein
LERNSFQLLDARLVARIYPGGRVWHGSCGWDASPCRQV